MGLLETLHLSYSEIKMNKEVRVAHMRDGKILYSVLFGRSEGKRPPGRIRADGSTILK
jgi:hypothetical protein